MLTRIERRGKKGTWWLIASLPGNRRLRRSLGTTDRTEAERLRREADAELSAGVVPQAALTVAQWTPLWLEAERALGRTPTTIAAYGVASRRWQPHIGSVRLSALGVADVQGMGSALMARGLHARTVRYTHEVLAIALHEAQRRSLVLRNVAALARKPPLPRGYGPQWLSRQDAARLLASAPGQRWGSLVAVAAYTGLRAGELCGLRWEDVDLHARALRVVRQRRRGADGAMGDAPPKAAASERVLPLAAPAVAWLEAVRERQAEASVALGVDQPAWVFSHRHRGVWAPYSPQAAAKGAREVYLLAGLAVPARPLHALRHTAGRSLSGTDMSVRARILGHASMRTTAWYTHADEEDLRHAVDAAAGNLADPDPEGEGTKHG